VESRIQLTSIDVTLMLSDIEHAAGASERLGPERWQQLLADHHLLVRRIVEAHDGQVVKFENDGFFASFNSAHGGLHAAVELQRTFAGGGSGGAGGGPGDGLALRVGVHSGFVIANPEQMLGRNVVLAARIAAKAKGGEILVSSTLKQYTETDPSFSFEERGEHHFKGVLGEHELFAVGWA
jgi:class 3 adenylate cyclase